MDELFPFLQPQGVEALLQEVLHSLHIVVGHRFVLLDAAGIVLCKILIDGAQCVGGAGRHIAKLLHPALAKGYKIFHLYLHAVTYQCELRKIAVKPRGFAAVTAIDRRNGCKGVKLHKEKCNCWNFKSQIYSFSTEPPNPATLCRDNTDEKSWSHNAVII